MDDRELKRAGLDYHEYARVRVHRDFAACRAALDASAGATLVRVHDRRPRARSTTRAFAPGDVLVFGCETARTAGRDRRAIRRRRAAAHPDASRRAQPQPVERRRRRRLRGLAADRICGRRLTARRSLAGVIGRSARGSRCSSASTACRGGKSFVEHAVDGVADRHVDAVVRARARARRVAAPTPSATWPSSARISRQRPAPAPARARRAGCATGRRCRSARDRPAPRGPSASRAGRRAPRTRRPVSARPRVISAARALWPKPRPSLAPAAIASTFFTAPPTSTPAMSSLS